MAVSVSKDRFTLSLPADKKARIKEWCRDHNVDVNEKTIQLWDEFLELQGEDPVEVQERRLERALNEIGDQIEDLEKKERSWNIATVLYLVFQQFAVTKSPHKEADWRAIRLQALDDYRNERGGWLNDSAIMPIKSELEIINACRLGTELLGLRKRRFEFDRELKGLYASPVAKAE